MTKLAPYKALESTANRQVDFYRKGRYSTLQGYFAHKKQPPPRTLQQAYAYGPMAVLGRGVVSYERGNPVWEGRSPLGWDVPLEPAGTYQPFQFDQSVTPANS